LAQLQFDATHVAPQAAFTPIPAGAYTVNIDDSEIKPTKSGQMAVFRLRVVEGQHAGRTVFARINIANASAEAERIGQSQLSALCHAAGVLQLADTAQLHNRVVRARVKIRKDDSYGDSNEVNGFEATGGPSPVAPAGFAAPAQQPSAPAGAVPPWKAKAA
jgi:hypothetical protein